MALPTLTSRKTARAQLTAVIKAAVETDLSIDTLAAYESEPKSLGGNSPALSVHGDGTATTFVDYAREFHRIWVTMYWLRDDPDTIEDAIDDLSLAVRQALIDNAELAGYWQDLIFDEDFSELAYVIIDGLQYRTERLRVTVFSVCDNS